MHLSSMAFRYDIQAQKKRKALVRPQRRIGLALTFTLYLIIIYSKFEFILTAVKDLRTTRTVVF